MDSSSITMHHIQKTALVIALTIISGLSISYMMFFASDVSATLFPGSDYCVRNNCTPEECAAVYPNDEAGYRVCTGQLGIP
ncbi:MAG: hypothetical protein ACRD5J_17415, partial [Nitrososphaeraceae archaeon]